jgi:hypothetical protein
MPPSATPSASVISPARAACYALASTIGIIGVGLWAFSVDDVSRREAEFFSGLTLLILAGVGVASTLLHGAICSNRRQILDQLAAHQRTLTTGMELGAELGEQRTNGARVRHVRDLQ